MAPRGTDLTSGKVWVSSLTATAGLRKPRPEPEVPKSCSRPQNKPIASGSDTVCRPSLIDAVSLRQSLDDVAVFLLAKGFKGGGPNVAD